MAKQSDLFTLVKSLTPAEKRYFRNYASRHVIRGKNNYLELFEVIEGMRAYDESKVKKKMSGVTPEKHFRVLKHHLQQQLLKSLASQSGSLDAQIQRLLLQVQVLYKKTFYKQSRKVLDKTRKLVSEHEKFLEWLAVIRWDQRLRLVMMDVSDPEELIEEEREVFSRLENAIAYNRIAFRILSLFARIGTIQRSEDLHDLKKIFSSPLLKNEENARSDRAKLLFNILHTHSNFHQRQFSTAYSYISRAKEIAETRPGLIRDNVFDYIVVLHNHLILSSELGRFEEIQPALESLKSLPKRFPASRSHNQDYWIWLLTSTFEIFYFLKIADYQGAANCIPGIESGLSNFASRITLRDEMIFHFNAAHTHFGLRDYSASLRHLNHLLNQSEGKVRRDILALARLLNLIVHFELENEELLEYRVKSISRQIRKNREPLKIEKLILDFFKSRLSGNHREKEKEALQTLRNQLQELENDPMEGRILGVFDFIAWIESKLRKRSFAELAAIRAAEKSSFIESKKPD